jgi:hypothetical protein
LKNVKLNTGKAFQGGLTNEKKGYIVSGVRGQIAQKGRERK